jgi:hypothetical protein
LRHGQFATITTSSRRRRRGARIFAIARIHIHWNHRCFVVSKVKRQARIVAPVSTNETQKQNERKLTWQSLAEIRLIETWKRGEKKHKDECFIRRIQVRTIVWEL